MRNSLLLLVLLYCMAPAAAQEYFPENSGLKTTNHNYTALTQATIYVSPTKKIENATLLIQDGKVVQVGKSVNIPKNSVTIDLEGKYIYPSFIDVFSDFGVAKPKRADGSGRSPQYEPTREGFYWNDHIMPEKDAVAHFKYDDKQAGALRKAGFGVVNSHIQDGIARGSGVLVSLDAQGSDANRILQDRSAQYFSFSKSVTSRQSYPTSLMGAMALLRQMYHDMDWYAQGRATTTDRALEALINNKELVQIFAAGENGNTLRADKIGDAAGIQYTILAGGKEYQHLEALKGTNATYIVPLNFPDAYDVSNPYMAEFVSLQDMRHWNQAPTNPKALAEAQIPISLTLHDIETKEFLTRLQKAVTYGLTKEQALAALTTTPAEILKQSDVLGSLESGKYANFLIASGDIFESGTVLYENWVSGHRHSITDMDIHDIRGDYTLQASGKTFEISITGEVSKPKASVKVGEESLKSKLQFSDNWYSLLFWDTAGEDYRLAGPTSNTGTLSGKLVMPQGQERAISLSRSNAPEEKESAKKDKEPYTIVPTTYPNMAYGNSSLPKAQTILFKNATVWTSEDAGILENTDVLVKDGKITKIGKDLRAGGAQTIDATGKHLTAGIVDEHSHLAALAINEAGHNSSAEVAMEDVVDPEDIGIYRDLAGGVTSMQLLHGSANPIGGQSAILKLKWGGTAKDMIYESAPKFIKFALGENVKQSNWQSFDRFPQTRMGVEQVFVNYFQRAKEYEALKKSGKPYRYDEEMEVLVEVLNGERFISCHSYVQSEINMLMKVADQFGFKVNTFTHILEGYKVADKMAAHGVGGSTFSDWWAYKYEVKDAIPYNAAIMAEQGITVAINSDDAEMSRRLNQEAAKTVKYGGVSEEEAWKMVTINPAKLLHIDDRVGSIKEGKDADLVLWSGHPLAVYSKAEKTLIEGAVYFDLEKDQQQRAAIQAERSKLINMMLSEKEGGKPTQKAGTAPKRHFHCDSL